MIDRLHDLPITRQAEALNIVRGNYLPRPVRARAGDRKLPDVEVLPDQASMLLLVANPTNSTSATGEFP